MENPEASPSSTTMAILSLRFGKDMEKANREFEFYSGRFYYRGWATRVNNLNGLQEVIRDTSVLLQWDQLGKEGYIVYPQ